MMQMDSRPRILLDFCRLIICSFPVNTSDAGVCPFPPEICAITEQDQSLCPDQVGHPVCVHLLPSPFLPNCIISGSISLYIVKGRSLLGGGLNSRSSMKTFKMFTRADSELLPWRVPRSQVRQVFLLIQSFWPLFFLLKNPAVLLSLSKNPHCFSKSFSSITIITYPPL